MSSRVEPITVLHVEDDQAFAELTADFLQHEDDIFSVVTEADADAGLERFEEGDLDCIVCDYDMPGRDGIEFLETIRDRDPDIPFILFTGKGSEEVASDALSAGATDYLQKEGGRDQFRLLANRVQNVVEQYRSEQERRRSQERYRRLLETAPMPILVYAADGEVRYANDAAVEYLNADSRSHLRGQRALNLSHPDEQPVVQERLTRMLERGEPAPPVEQKAVALDGEVKHAVVASTPVTFGDDPAIQSIIYDITDQRRAEERLSALADSFPDLAFIIDEDGRHAESLSSPTSSELMIGDAEEVVGQRLHDIMPTATADELLDVVRETIETESPQTVEYRLDVPAGERWFEARAAPLQSPLDGQRAVTWVARDVTERRHYERELERQNQRLEELAEDRRAAETRYRSLFENNPVVIWEDDASAAKEYADQLNAQVEDLRTYLRDNPEELDEIIDRTEVIDVNQRAVEYYEADSKDQVIENFQDLMTAEAVEASVNLWAGVAEGATHFRTEMTTRTFQGGIKHEIFEMRVPDAYADDYSRMFLTATDITERVQREREVERQNERLEEFTSVVSHDLRNPLNVAQGRLELARADRDDQDLAAVADALDRMGHLIDDLLLMAREGQEVDDSETVDVKSMVERCWQNVATEDATLEVSLARAIRADPSRLQQLFENLLRNAVEHGGTDVKIRVAALTDGTGFAVEDDGPGIPPSKRQTVFESGYSTGDGGTGFGLAIVRDIAEAHGWSVAATDGELGGARIEIRDVEFAGGN